MASHPIPSQPALADETEYKPRRRSRTDLFQFPELSEEDKQVVRLVEDALESSQFLTNDDIEALQIARRIIVSYGGVKAFVELQKMLKMQVSGPEIAKKFDVTRQRVNQWKRALGNEQCSFTFRSSLERVFAVQQIQSVK